MQPSNCNAFEEKWPEYSEHMLTTLAIHEKDADFFTCFSSDIESILALLKLMAPKPSGRRGKSPRTDPFQTIIDEFITFLQVN